MKKQIKITAIITAAGSGKRFSSSGKPKQYFKINGKPVILYSLIAFQKCRLVNEIIIAADKNYFELIHSLVLKDKITKLTKLVEGGKTRFDSVRNAFDQIEAVSANDIVIIHDAARPNIDSWFIERLLIGIGKQDGIVPGIKISDTIKRVQNTIITETVNREGLYSAQTPQVFKYNVLKTSYLKCGRSRVFTDEAALAEFAGFKIKVVPGNTDNIKITDKEDFDKLKSVMSGSMNIKYLIRPKRYL